VPKARGKVKAKRTVKRWSCPSCGAEITSKFDGKRVWLLHNGEVFAACGGRYVEFEAPCPSCGDFISFSREELEGEED